MATLNQLAGKMEDLLPLSNTAMASAATLLLSSLFFALSSSGAAQPQQIAGTVTIPSTNPIIVYPPAITVPAAVFPPPPPPFTYPLPPQSWCVARPGTTENMVQVALDYACGSGGVDCSAIQPAGSCFIPNTLLDHASYAFNTYYQRNPTPASCSFGGAAILVSVNPSTPTCTYPTTSPQPSPVNTYTPIVSIPSPPTVYGNIPTPTISNPSQTSISNPTGTGAVFGPNNPLGSTPTNTGLTASSSAISAAALTSREPTSLSNLTLLIVSVFMFRWQWVVVM